MSGKTFGQWAGAIIGTVIGVFTGNVMLGYAIGTAIGGYLDPPKGPTIEGPRLSDLNVQISSLGAPMGRVYGTVGLQGNVFWVENNEIKEVIRKDKQGGKGGGGGATVETYSYFATFAVALCEGPVDGIRKVWVGNDLIYNSGSTKLGTLIASSATGNSTAGGGFKSFIASALLQHIRGNKGVKFRFYSGTSDQPVDSRIEADLGVGRTPAFRGTAYIVFYDLPLARYGNTLLGAQVKAEVVRNGSPTGACEPVVTWDDPLLGTGTYSATMSLMLSGGRIYNRTVDGIEIRSTDGEYLGIESGMAVPDGYEVVHVAPNNPRLQLIREDGGNGDLYIGSGEIPLGGIDNPYRSGTCVDLGDDRFIVGGRRADGSYTITSYAATGLQESETASPQTIGGQTGATKSGRTVYFWAFDYIIGVDIDDLEIVGEWYVGAPSGYSNARTPLGVIGNLAYIRTDSASGAPYEGASVIRLLDNNAIELVCELPDTRFHANLNDSTVVSIGDPAKFFSPGLERGGYEILGNVVRAELERSELIEPGDIDTADLTDDVRGYRIAGVQQIRAVLSPLQGAYPFDLIPSGYQLKALRRGKASVKTIPVEELDARGYGSEVRPMLEQAREMDSQLPRKVTLRYLDATREYEINEQYSPERVSSQAVNIREFEIPLVLDNDQAAGIAEVLQYVPWLERTPMTFRLGPEHLDLEPADVITIDAPYGQFPLRLDSIKYSPDGVLECTSRPNAPSVWTPNSVGADGVVPDEEVGLAADTIIELMDIPLIRDADDQPGFAAAMAGTSEDWDGGVLFRSIDNGQTWQDVQAWAAPVTMGYARNALAANDGYVIDRASLLQVDLTAGTLESITEAQMMTGLHWVAYGADKRWELIRFADADLQADGSYILSTLIRGARGTEWATGLHQAGDAVVLLDDADVLGILTSVETLSLVMQWRGVSAGQDISTADNEAFAYRGVNLRPLSPVHPVGMKLGEDWSIGAIRRSRYTTSWWTTGVGRPLGEASEGWEVDILDGAVVVRTLAGPTLPIVYTEAQQIEDFGAAVELIDVSICQMSAIVGRGYPLMAHLIVEGADPYRENVVALLHFDGDDGSTAIVDETGKAWTAMGDAQLDASQSRFGVSSLMLDGSGDYIITPDSPDWYFGAEDFTLEAWVRPNSLTYVPVFAQTVAMGSNASRWHLDLTFGFMTFVVFDASNDAIVTVQSSVSIAADTWYHVAVSRSGDIFRLFLDGVQQGGDVVNATAIPDFAGDMYIGFQRYSSESRYFSGHIDFARITKGIARYTSNFTPGA